MKRHLLVALAVLTVTPGVASSQMARMPASEMSGGMMGQCKEMMGGGMMSGGMMGPDMMGAMMPSVMDKMMPGKTRGCMMMAEGMMKGQVDLAQMRKAIALSDEQVERLRAGQRPFQKETILTLASLKVAELDLADLLAADKADFGKVEAKLKEIEGMRTKVRLAHVKAALAVKGILSVEQLEKLQGMSESAPPPAPPQPGVAPPAVDEHERHH